MLIISYSVAPGMIRQMIRIDDEKCNGCGVCTEACHEGALALVDGKAKLIRDDLCDGLGNCLPACPQDAITFETREAAPFDEAAVERNKQSIPITGAQFVKKGGPLKHWPVQMKLIPSKAPYFDDSDVVIAADCTAYAFANFHGTFIKDNVVMIGCPKFDSGDYSMKLAEIFSQNRIKTVTVVKMEVPCCSNLDKTVMTALAKVSAKTPYRVITISTNGNIL
jgi:MinD superfamily P-loop ATPase containing an inserted ferredoxin domain